MSEAFSLVAETLVGLPCLTLAGQGSAPDAPPALVLHGLGRNKESVLPTLYAFARRGLRALAFDAHLHGERPGAGEREMRLAASYPVTMAEIIEETTGDVSQLLDHLGASRAGVHGISMGGYVAFAALAADPRLVVGAVAMGSPDWLEPLHDLGLTPGHPFYEAVAARSPLERAANYPPRPLLMLHGDSDSTVSVAGVRALYGRLQPLYQTTPHHLELVIYPGLDHYYTDDMVERSASWIARFLPPSNR